MATPGQLVQAMADALGIAKATVVQYDRVLAENGFRSMRGRGTSAAKVTSQDAAHLLTAIGASYLLGLSAKDAVVICKKFSALISVGPAEAKSEVAKFGLEVLATLPVGHSFEKALSTLIKSAGEPGFSAGDDAGIWVQFVGPIPAAQIVVGATLFGHYVDPRRYKHLSLGDRVQAGFAHTTSVSTPTIRALGALVAGRNAQRLRHG